MNLSLNLGWYLSGYSARINYGKVFGFKVELFRNGKLSQVFCKATVSSRSPWASIAYLRTRKYLQRIKDRSINVDHGVFVASWPSEKDFDVNFQPETDLDLSRALRRYIGNLQGSDPGMQVIVFKSNFCLTNRGCFGIYREGLRGW